MKQRLHDRPNSVAIVAMGSSAKTYLGFAVSKGSRYRVADEIWTINSCAAALHHDRAFIMDDLVNDLGLKEDQDCMARGMFDWLYEHPGPIYTSRAYPEIPGSVEYPLGDVLTSLGVPYLNTTVAYAVAYAMYLKVQHIHLYGCDFTYPDRHAAEAGRACVEMLVGMASAKGVKFTVASDSTLMNANEDMKFYGYLNGVTLARDDQGRFQVIKGEDTSKVPEVGRVTLPTPPVESNGHEPAAMIPARLVEEKVV